jgi:hypothetical protein
VKREKMWNQAISDFRENAGVLVWNESDGTRSDACVVINVKAC